MFAPPVCIRRWILKRNTKEIRGYQKPVHLFSTLKNLLRRRWAAQVLYREIELAEAIVALWTRRGSIVEQVPYDPKEKELHRNAYQTPATTLSIRFLPSCFVAFSFCVTSKWWKRLRVSCRSDETCKYNRFRAANHFALNDNCNECESDPEGVKPLLHR